MNSFDRKASKAIIRQDISIKSGNVFKAWIAGLIGTITTLISGIAGAAEGVDTATSDTVSFSLSSNGLVSILVLVLSGAMIGGFYAFCTRANHEGIKGLQIESIFDKFKDGQFTRYLIMGIVMEIVVSIGFVLLIVPGIILSLGLTMAPLILNDNPEMSGIDAIKASWNLMKGHKMDLFVINISFIGWYILAVITVGILGPWVNTYNYRVVADFYESILPEKEAPAN